MIIYIKTLTGKTLTLEAEADDNILTLKEKIATEEAIQTNQQRLLFKNTELEDKKTLSEYGLYNEATVYLVVRMNQPQVNIQQPKPQANPTQKVSIPGYISFIIQIGDKSELSLNLPSSTTIQKVKEEIRKQSSIRGEIILNFEGQTLVDTKTLADYNVTSSSNINLTVRLTGGI